MKNLGPHGQRAMDHVLSHQPDAGSTDHSECLPEWVETLAKAYYETQDYALSRSAVGHLLHTLLCAKIRTDRLVARREELERAVDDYRR